MPSTVKIFDPITNTLVDSLFVPGQGSWVTATTGTVTFTPLSSYIGTTPNPIEYVVFDAQGTPSNLATVTIGTSLSVDLVFFKGNTGISGNTLTWKAKNETGFAYFEILKSRNLGEFVAIGRVNGGSNTGNYQYVETEDVFGLNYYQLRMVNTDGTTEKSKIIALRNLDSSEGVNVYPNPSPTHIFKLSGKANLQSLTVFNTQGVQIQVEPKLVDGQIELDMRGQTAGNYLIRVTTPSGYTTKRIVIE